MPDYKINIITEADNSGAQSAAQGLQDVGKATETAGEHTHAFNTKGREMHEIMHKLNELVPGLGHALGRPALQERDARPDRGDGGEQAVQDA